MAEVERLTNEFESANEHIIECQRALGKHGLRDPGDGSVVVGINLLAGERDEARAEVERLTKDRDESAKKWRDALESEGEKWAILVDQHRKERDELRAALETARACLRGCCDHAPGAVLGCADAVQAALGPQP